MPVSFHKAPGPPPEIGHRVVDLSCLPPIPGKDFGGGEIAGFRPVPQFTKPPGVPQHPGQFLSGSVLAHTGGPASRSLGHGGPSAEAVQVNFAAQDALQLPDSGDVAGLLARSSAWSSRSASTRA
ncbi:hypothetical protein [Paractinoplanes atraurantiacus]|uniref:Uncharacterized protein n=1 Tax=Paractinoplanes atraurantiacus TaxID=1036182 RepID=A0A285KG33_9ACTN|nr:hypothetical protein [Actinoplanes atraurantiacus]SNY71582.1 hypothetical protein SAMN05421748_14059 [Actinoplanes atraurantiacus]